MNTGFMKHMTGKVMAGITSASLVMTSLVLPVNAAPALEAGTYEVEATFSAYVNAMGGQQFGAPLLRDENEIDNPDAETALAEAANLDTDKVRVNVADDGSKTITMYLKRGAVVIYGVEAFTFVDAAPENPGNSRGVTDGTIGVYDAEGNLVTEGVSYTLSSSTGTNPQGNEVNYVNSITFPIDDVRDVYKMSLHINSQVMGVQFTEPNAAATATTYSAGLTVNWDTAAKIGGGTDPTPVDPTPVDPTPADEIRDAQVQYEVTEITIPPVTNTYEVEIPAVIVVEETTKIGNYNVVAKNFDLEAGAYVSVNAADAGTLTNGSSSVAFTNALDDVQLKVSGDTMAGVVTVTDTPDTTGMYSGTLSFTIKLNK